MMIDNVLSEMFWRRKTNPAGRHKTIAFDNPQAHMMLPGWLFGNMVDIYVLKKLWL